MRQISKKLETRVKKYILDDLSYREISKIVGISHSTVILQSIALKKS